MLYLLRFTKPIGSPKHQAQFYLGYCEDGRVNEQIAEHAEGRGARITAAAIQQGAELNLVWTGEGGRADERRLKKRRHHHRLIERAGGNEKHAG